MRNPALVWIAAVGLTGALAFGWITIRRGFSARDSPSAMEALIAKTARRLSIPASERDAKNPFVPSVAVLSYQLCSFSSGILQSLNVDY